jgi:hypothetical protein
MDLSLSQILHFCILNDLFFGISGNLTVTSTRFLARRNNLSGMSVNKMTIFV